MLINGMGLITHAPVPEIPVRQTPGGQVIKLESQSDPDSSNMDRIIAGAIYDFAGFLTTLDPTIQVGATEHPEPVINAIITWAATRGLSIDQPFVQDWKEQADASTTQTSHK